MPILKKTMKKLIFPNKFKTFILDNIKLISVLLLVIFVTAAMVLPMANAFYWHKAGHDVVFKIDSGDSTRVIAKKLKSEKLITSEWAFLAIIYTNHWYLQSGVYSIKSDMNMFSIARMINVGRVDEYSITIPEGWRVTQIDDELVKKNIIKKGELTKITSANEGYLFPNTYSFALDVTPQKIKDSMMTVFLQETENLKITDQTIILASIVEREAKTDEDRPKIAGVYLNRLNIGMKLDADPTIQYGKGSWAPIKKTDYKNFQSPYNTYLHAGLPPTPICNPGLKSIQAVLNPEKSDYFYFFHKTNGEAVFSKTYAEHLANLEKN